MDSLAALALLLADQYARIRELDAENAKLRSQLVSAGEAGTSE